MERLNTVSSHLTGTARIPGSKSSEDVVIVSAIRTPICRAKKGFFKDSKAEDLLSAVLKGIIDKTGINPALVEDIIVGNVLPPGGGAAIARMAALYAGFPESTSVATVNRQCSSGLQAVASIVSAIESSFIEIGIGAGVESMTNDYGPNAMPSSVSEKVSSLKSAADCLIPMGITSENVASRFHVDRKKQDEFAALSHQKAAAAQKNGYFEEILPVKVTVLDENGKSKEVFVSQDDGVRGNTTAAGLSKLRPAFSESGSTTAGNASQVSDGAAAVLLMKRKTAQKLNLPILGKFVSFATVGVPPEIMGIGPAYAIPIALKKAGLSIKDIGVFEINEAFASQAVYCIEKLGLDMSKVNPNGGAIAFGHPLGCTGARQIATLMPELKRLGQKYGVVSMCIGTGMGAAAVIERE